MAVIKSISFREDDHLLRYINDICKVKRKRFSEIVREALWLYVEKNTKAIQTRLDTFKSSLEVKLDKLHAEFVLQNPERFGTWEELLKAKGMYIEEAIQYSMEKGWLRPPLHV